MLHTISTWLAVAAFAGAGSFNAIGLRGTQEDFAHWGFPRWWCHVTGGLEIASAALIVFPASRGVGLTLGSAIIVAAAIAVLRRREFSHAAPLGLFAGLLVLAIVAP